MFYIVAYGISDPKRLRRVFKAMRAFGKHAQYSVFECTLDDRELAEILDKVKRIMKMEEDNEDGRR